MVSEEIIETLKLKIEHSTKAVEAVDGGGVTYFGSSPVDVEYQGCTTQTRLLVTDKLKKRSHTVKDCLKSFRSH